MATDDKPLSQLVSQGWEIVGFSASQSHQSGMISDSVLLRRQKSHKILKVRRKMFGGGLTFTELDI